MLVLNVGNTYAANGNNTTSKMQTLNVSYAPSEINDAASRVKTSYETNKKLPNYVTIRNVQVTMPQFLNLLSTDIIQTSQGSTKSIPLKNVETPSNPTGTTKGGILQKTEYINLAKETKNTIDTTGKAPNNVKTSIGQIKFQTLVYIFAKVMNFYKNNDRLPNYVIVPTNTNGQTQTQAQTQAQKQAQKQTQAQTQAQKQTLNVSYAPSEINDAASRVKTSYETNKKLPNYVTIRNVQVTMPQFLNLLSTDIIQTSQGSTKSIPLKNVETPSNPTGTTKGGILQKTEYINLAKETKNTIDTTGKAPNNVKTSIGQIKFQTLVYIFAKVMNFYKNNDRLPNYVIVPTNTNGQTQTQAQTQRNGTGHTNLGNGQLNGLQGTEGLEILASYINRNLNHRYGAATTADGVERTGFGDCWGLSAWTAEVLHDNGYTVRIVQGSSIEASNHRWVQVLMNGNWINFDPSLVTKKYGSQPYYHTCASVSQIIATYT